MEITLESLGFTKKQLQDRVVSVAVDELLSGRTYDEDGNTEVVDTKLRANIDKLIKERMDETIRIFAEKEVLPRVTELIESTVFQQTNNWGEAKGKALSFKEFLIDRAENYLSEPVDSSGKSEKEYRSKGDSWYGSKTPRIFQMIDRHLCNKIEDAMKDALKIANQALSAEIQSAVQVKLSEITQSIKVGVKTKA